MSDYKKLLEMKQDDWIKSCKEIDKLKQAYEKLKVACEFYSNQKDWYYWQPNGDRDTANETSRILKDSGKTARIALKEAEEILK